MLKSFRCLRNCWKVNQCRKFLGEGKRICLLHRVTYGGDGSPYFECDVGHQPLLQIRISMELFSFGDYSKRQLETSRAFFIWWITQRGSLRHQLFDTVNNRQGSIMVVTRSRAKQQRVSGNEYSFGADDQISKLPDAILQTILEKLPLEDARSTLLLARRWKNLWKSISIIEINDQMEKDGGKKVSRLLKEFIRLYQGTKLKSFSVFVKFEGKKRAEYMSWMAFAVSKNVEELSLDLYRRQKNYSKPDPTMRFPDNLFNCSSLVQVKLTFANLDPLPSFHLKLLRELQLNKCQLPDDGVEIITANCTILKILVLSNCNKDRHLKVTVSPDSILSTLVIDDKEFWNTHKKTSINAPKVTALEILASSWVRRYSIDNVSDAVEATLSFEAMRSAPYIPGYMHRIKMNVARVIQQLQPAKKLHLCTRGILSVLETRERNLQFNATRLELDTRLDNAEAIGILVLLRACPGLEQLVLNFKDFPVVHYEDYNLGDLGTIDQESIIRASTVAVFEFKNLQGPYQTWSKRNFERYRFFESHEIGIDLVRMWMSMAAKVPRFVFKTAHRQTEIPYRE